MYAIFTYIWFILMVNVCNKNTMPGCYRIWIIEHLLDQSCPIALAHPNICVSCSDDSLNHSLSGNRWAWQDRTKHKVYQVNDMEQYANIEQNGKITLKAPPNLAIYLRTCCAKYLSGNIYCIHTCFMVHFCFLLYFTMVESMMSP